MRIMSFLAGTFAGAVVGATAALLLAPESGEELRMDVRSRYETIVSDARRAAEEKRAQLEAQLENMRRPRSGEEEAAG
jgi:gas vesicle protein